jgi:hypothetical protein
MRTALLHLTMKENSVAGPTKSSSERRAKESFTHISANM